jgi:hypothetical protein
MAHLDFHRNACAINSIFYENARSLTEKVCNALGHPDRIDEMVNKFLDKSHAKIRPKKDVAAPKRGKSSFIIYSNEVRAEVQEKNSGVKAVDISKIIGKMWSALSETEKEKYVQLSGQDRTRYQDEKEVYDNKIFVLQAGEDVL